MNLAVFSTKPYDKEYFEKFKDELSESHQNSGKS
jgi:hypothetical protein